MDSLEGSSSTDPGLPKVNPVVTRGLWQQRGLVSQRLLGMMESMGGCI